MENKVLDSVAEAIDNADFRHLATACLAVPLLIARRHNNPNWGEWRLFCQIEQETGEKLANFKGAYKLHEGLTTKLIKAGVFVMLAQSGAGQIVREVINREVDVDMMAAGVVLVTIYSLAGARDYRSEVVIISGMGEWELKDRLKAIGVTPDPWTVSKLLDLFARLPEYL